MPIRSSSSVRIFYPKFDQAYLLRILPERLKILQRELQLLRVVLFGSYAKGTFTVGSDVDLLIVYKGEERADAYAIVKKSLDIPHLEPHLYSEEEYKKMERLINRMSDGGILILPKEPPNL
jgi:predicted nucleotidyltransferase